MTFGLVLIMVGIPLMVSGFKNYTVKEILTGEREAKPSDAIDTNSLDATVSSVAPTTFTPGASSQLSRLPQGTSGTALLIQLGKIAENQFHLDVHSSMIPGAPASWGPVGKHGPGSLHYVGRAFDASGTEANMQAFDRYVHDHYGPDITELIHNPGPYNIKNGKDVPGAIFYIAVWMEHKNHVHVGI